MPSQLEALKWLAVLAMLTEHTFQYLNFPGAELARAFGRLAFPLFVLAFAFALAQRDSLAAERAAFRLLPFAVAAQIGAELVRGDGILNILFQFLAVAAWVAASSRPVHVLLTVRVIALLIGLLSEFTLPGFFLCLACVRLAQRLHVGWGAVVFGCMGLIAAADGTLTAFLAVPLLYLASVVHIDIPRIRNAFAWVYVLQFPVFLALRAIL